MRSLKSVWNICRNNFRKWASNYRIICIGVLLVMLVHMFTKDIRLFVADFNIKITPYIFPFFFTQKYCRLLFLFPLILLYCDAPFIDANQPYIISRSGRKLWCVGQLLYIVISSFVYFFFILLLSVLINIRYITFSMDWGKLIATFYKTSAARDAGIPLWFSATIPEYFSPVQALCFSLLLLSLSGIFLGFLIFCLNTVAHSQAIGIIFASGFLLLDAALNGSGNLLWVSPVSWNNIGNIAIGNSLAAPNIQYIYTGYTVSILLLMTISLLFIKRKDIQTLSSLLS